MAETSNLTASLDQIGGMLNDLADMTVAYQKRLKDLPAKVRNELVQEVGVRLIVTFVPIPSDVRPADD